MGKRLNKIQARTNFSKHDYPKLSINLQDYEWLIEQAKKAETLELELQKMQGIALHWEGESNYWENQFYNKE